MSKTENLILENADFFQIAQEFLESGQQVKFTLKGFSMLPFLRQGDAIWLEAAKYSELRTGDILLVKWKGLFILHRLVFRNRTQLYLAGDNNLFRIEKVSCEDVMARVTRFERKGKQVSAAGAEQRIRGILWFMMRPARWAKYSIAKILRR